MCLLVFCLCVGQLLTKSPLRFASQSSPKNTSLTSFNGGVASAPLSYSQYLHQANCLEKSLDDYVKYVVYFAMSQEVNAKEEAGGSKAAPSQGAKRKKAQENEMEQPPKRSKNAAGKAKPQAKKSKPEQQQQKSLSKPQDKVIPTEEDLKAEYKKAQNKVMPTGNDLVLLLATPFLPSHVLFFCAFASTSARSAAERKKARTRVPSSKKQRLAK